MRKVKIISLCIIIFSTIIILIVWRANNAALRRAPQRTDDKPAMPTGAAPEQENHKTPAVSEAQAGAPAAPRQQDVSQPIVLDQQMARIKSYAKEFRLAKEWENALITAARQGVDPADESDSKKTTIKEIISNIVFSSKVAMLKSAYTPSKELASQMIAAATPPQTRIVEPVGGVPVQTPQTRIVETETGTPPLQNNSPDSQRPEQKIDISVDPNNKPTVYPKKTSPDIAPAAESKTKDNEVYQKLSCQALATIGFSCMADSNYDQAKQAFVSLLTYYPDSEEASIVMLELARLYFEQGNSQGALHLVNNAIYQYREDNDYVTKLAKPLKELIEKDVRQ